MKALVLHPSRPQSLEWRDIEEPDAGEGELLCETLAVGLCGTDRDLFEGKYGEAPRGRDRLIIGHESWARVLEAPPSSAFKTGDHLIGFVRRPDPAPCRHCAAGEWDLCETETYTEHGIKGLDGFARERFRISAQSALPVDPRLGEHAVLIEPASVVAKAWEHTDRFLGRSAVVPRNVLVLGAGPVGLLAALMGRQRHLHVHVFDRHENGSKPELTRKAGATYHSNLDTLERANIRFDAVFECTGSSELLARVLKHLAPDAVLCLVGLSPGEGPGQISLAKLNEDLVLHNKVLFGSVNANRRHYEKAHQSLLETDPAWLGGMITRRVPFANWRDAFHRQDDDIKVLLVAADEARELRAEASRR